MLAGLHLPSIVQALILGAITSGLVVWVCLRATKAKLDTDEANAKVLKDQSLPAHDISVQTSKIAIGSAEVSHFIDLLNKSIESNGEHASAIAVAAGQLSHTTAQLGDNAADILGQAQEAERVSVQGRSQAQKGVAAIRSLSTDIDTAAEQVQALKSRAEEIQKSLK